MMPYNTFEELLDDTEIYCERGSTICEGTGNILTAWWMSDKALEDIESLYWVM